MSVSRWDRIEVLLERAREVPAAHRGPFVERETRGDPELHAELSALLNASEGAEEYLGRLRHQLLGSSVQGILREASATHAAPDPWVGHTVSHYEILDRIGGGGMGVIYRARDTRLDRTVALKFIAPEIRRDSEARRRFLLEARAASALDHPNICTIHEIAETDDGRLFIVMAAYEGETLRARIARGSLSEREALDIGEEIASALAAAHERGIVHRDVKPDNVFVTGEGVVKLLDFGLAHSTDSPMSGSGTVEGTVAYMSPEQVNGQRADERSDVWALGVILFEMLAGVRPFATDDPRETVNLILAREPDLRAARPDLAPECCDLVHRALAKQPAARFASGRQLLEALQGLQAAPVSPALQRPARAPRALRTRTTVVGMFTIATLLSLRSRANPDPARFGVAAGSVSHVLWVDDDPANNAEVIQQLADRGVQVTTALNTADALLRYDAALHQFVISDMGRYEGTNDEYVGRAGFDLLSRLRARRPDVQFVFCTSARAATVHRLEALSSGALEIVADCREILRLIGF